MKKLLIVNNNLHIGGVQKALISLLWNIKDSYDVTLLLFYNGGECVKDLPEGVKVITSCKAYKYIGMTRNDTKNLSDKFGRAFFAAIARIFGRKYSIALMSLFQKEISGYDTAISYLHNAGDKMFYGGCNDFVLRHVKVNNKITFLHGDYIKCGAHTAGNALQYASFNTVAACSNGCAESFIKACPELRDKVKVVENCHRFDMILKDAESAPTKLTENKLNIVTVARMGKEKGVERAVKAISRLGELKDVLHYYIVGDGVQRPIVEQIIEEESLEQTVTLCGLLENPYGYIKAADLLLIPSYSEAAPLVIGEAAFLGTPILSTETSSAKEMIEKTGYGWVCENSEEGLVEGLKMLLKDKTTVYVFKKNMKRNGVNNALAVQNFSQIV